ncbi:EscU/YscU/HrcU family type III secretion system export apparatus switch protein [Shewanella sp.]|nr:EscU/YscU/HrcU family type III secretion system export apparatus switch protein [Shewanella sp.]
MDPHSGSTQAVALTYTEGAAPILSAKAEAALAQEMIALAEDAGVFIHKDPQLCDFLQQLAVGDTIPEALYLLIAELIAFAYVLDGKFPEKWNNMHQKILDQV